MLFILPEKGRGQFCPSYHHLERITIDKKKRPLHETKQIHKLLKIKSNHKIKCITQWKLKQVQRIFIVEIISQYLDGCMNIIRIFITLQAAYKGNLKYLESLSHQGRRYSLFKGSNEPRDFTKKYIYIYIYNIFLLV